MLKYYHNMIFNHQYEFQVETITSLNAHRIESNHNEQWIDDIYNRMIIFSCNPVVSIKLYRLFKLILANHNN
jgi:hypothetical protein